jgi:hypothetical protein
MLYSGQLIAGVHDITEYFYLGFYAQVAHSLSKGEDIRVYQNANSLLST